MITLSEYQRCEQGFRGPWLEECVPPPLPSTDSDVEPVRLEENRDAAAVLR